MAESVEPPRERGIWAPLGVLILLSYLAQVPLFRILIPFPVPLVALAPLVAAAALAGWFREGGFPALPIFWVGTSVALLGRLLQVGGAFAPLAGGWLLLLALAFTVRLVRWPDRPMLVQAGWSVAATAAATLAVLLVSPGGLAGAVTAVGEELGARALAASREWQAMTATPAWQELVASAPAWAEMAAEVERQLDSWPARVRGLFPALVVLQSLLTLALAWAMVHRLGRRRVGPPMSALRSFRFDDRLVWGVVLGLALVAAPGDGRWQQGGVNLLVVFGALYAIRGMGVMVWFLAPGRWQTLAWGVLTLLFWPVIGAVAIGLGLGDTWFVWRRDPRRESQRVE